MNTEHTNIGWGFWLAWVLASIMGFGMGAVLGLAVAYGLFYREGFDATQGITLGIVMGAIGGSLQWVVLREKVARAGWWVLASALGLAVAGGAPGAATGPTGAITADNWAMAVTLFGVIFGLVAGTMQWQVLKQAQIARAGWWVLASIFGSLVGALCVPAAGAIQAATDNYVLGGIVFGLLFGAGLGAIPGAALVWLLRQSHSSDIQGLATAH